MNYCYVIFVITGMEQQIVEQLKKILESEMYMPYAPMIVELFKKNGAIQKETSILFPGYVFIESNLTGNEFIQKTNNLYKINGIIKKLDYGKKMI